MYYFCKPNQPRGLEVNQLHKVFIQNGFLGSAYNSVNEAYKAALNKANKEDVVYIGGSTFVVAEII